MKTPTFFFSLLLSSFLAPTSFAMTFQQDVAGEIRVFSVIQTAAPIGDFVVRDSIPFRLPNIGKTNFKTGDGLTNQYQFGLGKVTIQKDVTIMDPNKGMIVRPVTVEIEVTPSAFPNKKHLRILVSAFNPFSGKQETVKMESTPEQAIWDESVTSSFLYREQFFVNPEAKTHSIPMGGLVASEIFIIFNDLEIID